MNQFEISWAINSITIKNLEKRISESKKGRANQLARIQLRMRRRLLLSAIVFERLVFLMSLESQLVNC